MSLLVRRFLSSRILVIRAKRSAKPGAILRASLYFIVGDFHDDLRSNAHRIAIIG